MSIIPPKHQELNLKLLIIIIYIPKKKSTPLEQIKIILRVFPSKKTKGLFLRLWCGLFFPVLDYYAFVLVVYGELEFLAVFPTPAANNLNRKRDCIASSAGSFRQRPYVPVFEFSSCHIFIINKSLY